VTHLYWVGGAGRADLWALGCMIFQMLAGRPPFKGPNEYQTFQRITKLEYTFPDGFPEAPRDLVRQLLVRALLAHARIQNVSLILRRPRMRVMASAMQVLDPGQRLGAGPEGCAAVKRHPFFAGVDWAALPTTTPPKVRPFGPRAWLAGTHADRRGACS
jgi:3-phosphoinositide dependent protein kinase-1